jgi:hypothetical protein
MELDKEPALPSMKRWAAFWMGWMVLPRLAKRFACWLFYGVRPGLFCRLVIPKPEVNMLFALKLDSS